MKYSIIIPVAPGRDAPVLRDVKNLDYPNSEYQVFVIQGTNPSENRNKGIAKAQGEILLFLDDDCYIESDLLKKADKIFETYNPDVLGGPQLTPKDDNFFAKTSGYVIASYFGSHKMSARYKKSKINLKADENTLTSAIVFIKKQVFNKTEPFNTKLFPGEDPELFARLKYMGLKLIYHPDIYMYHKRRPNFKQFIKQFYNYGKVAAKNEKRKSTKLSPLFIFPLLCILYTLIYLPILILYPFSNTIMLILSLPFIVYALITLIMAFYLGIANKSIKSIPLIPLIYLAEHSSYGLGMMSSWKEIKKN